MLYNLRILTFLDETLLLLTFSPFFAVFLQWCEWKKFTDEREQIFAYKDMGAFNGVPIRAISRFLLTSSLSQLELTSCTDFPAVPL
jgi:hypothetical protein